MAPKTKRKKKSNKKTHKRKKAILHPSHFIIPLKNALTAGIITVQLIGRPIVALGKDVIKKLGRDIPRDILENTKFLITDTIMGTDKLSKKLMQTKKKRGGRRRKRRRTRSSRRRHSRKRARR